MSSLADHLRYDHRRLSQLIEDKRAPTSILWVLADLDQAARHIERLELWIDNLRGEVDNARAAAP